MQLIVAIAYNYYMYSPPKKKLITMDFKKCESLTTVDTSNWDFSKCSRMVILDTMNFNQIQWCKERNIIENLPLRVTKQLNMCAFYALIPSDLIDEFDAL